MEIDQRELAQKILEKTDNGKELVGEDKELVFAATAGALTPVGFVYLVTLYEEVLMGTHLKLF